MNITVESNKLDDNKLEATVVVDAADVEQTVKKTYKDIAAKYNFQGFRRGRAPRPVIDGILGKESVLAQATNDLVEAVNPQVIDELDIVPVGNPSFPEDAPLLEDKKNFTFTVTYELRPEAELDSYEKVAINMPPAEVTDAEVEWQIRNLLKYRASYENTTSKRKIAKGDVIGAKVEALESAEWLAGEDVTIQTENANGMYPQELIDGLIGMKPGESKEIAWKHEHTHEDHVHSHDFKVNVTVLAHKELVTPEFNDELAKSSFGYDTADEAREALKQEIAADKETSLPNLKEDRVVEVVGKRLQLEEVPANYLESVYNELAQDFLASLNQQGVSLDMFLASRGVQVQDFIADLRQQSEERARQALALDAVVRHENFDVTDEEVEKEFAEAGVEDVKASIKQWKSEGRLPALRESIRRTKALKWLAENAEVTIVDEIAERLAKEDEEKASKSKKSSKKKAEEAPATEE